MLTYPSGWGPTEWGELYWTLLMTGRGWKKTLNPKKNNLGQDVC